MSNLEKEMTKEELSKLIDDNLDAMIDSLEDGTEMPPAMKALVGAVMRVSKGKANPILARRLLFKRLMKD